MRDMWHMCAFALVTCLFRHRSSLYRRCMQSDTFVVQRRPILYRRCMQSDTFVVQRRPIYGIYKPRPCCTL